MFVKSFSLPLSATGDVVAISVESDSGNINFEDFKNMSYLRNIIHSSTIRPRFRIMLLNYDDTIKYQIPNSDIISGGSFSENYQNGQRKSFSFSLINEDGKYTPSIDSIWVGTRFSLEIGIELPDELTTVWFKKGVFVTKSANPSRSNGSKVVSIECTDKFGFLESKACTIDDTLTIGPETEIEQIINDVLTDALGNGSIVDYKPIIYHTSFKGRKTPLTITENSGSTYGSLLLQLAEILSAEIFYNSYGNLVIIPNVDVITDSDKPVLDNFQDTKGDYQNNDFSFDFTSFINRVIVVGGNINGHTCRAEAVNDDPASPISTGRVGVRTTIVTDSNITTDMLAQERADYELRKVLIAKSSQSSTVFFNPLLSVNNLVTFSDDFYDLKRERFLIQSLSYSLGYDGTMSISTSNLNNLPFVV